MENKTFIPDHYKMVYIQHQSKKTFIELKLQTAEIPLLTDLIRIERNNGYNDIKDANYLLLIRDNKNWKKCTLGGLRETETPNYYYSDFPVETIKSLTVIKIIGDFEVVEIRVCRKYYPLNNPKLREEIIKHIIQHWEDSTISHRTNPNTLF